MLFLFSLVTLAIACSNDELHVRTDVHAELQYPQAFFAGPHKYSQVTAPYPRKLVWGNFNVIHTTDFHGWYLGHQHSQGPEPNYNGTLGDFASFVSHMNQIANDQQENNSDLLLVDTGDLHDGSGLTEGDPGVDGHKAIDYLRRIPYDLMTIGNHEVENYTITLDMYNDFIHEMNRDGCRYLTSNVDIILPNTTVRLPIGCRSATFKTRGGRTVTSFGVLFDKGVRSAKNIVVQNIADMVKQDWFTAAIKEEPDVFVILGHMPINSSDPNYNWDPIFKAIRDVHPNTPLLIFGGHSHIRDCRRFNKTGTQVPDGRSMALESGRFMETIGWMSADLPAKGDTSDIKFSRRYLDQNKKTYQYHTDTDDMNFDTQDGLDITKGLKELAKTFGLDQVYGTAPQSYSFDHGPPECTNSAFQFFVSEAIPFALAINNPRSGTPNITITNNGVLRYSIFEGPFNKNDQFTASPYLDAFGYIQGVKADIAKQVLGALKDGKGDKDCPKPTVELWSREYDESSYHAWLQDMYAREAGRGLLAEDLTYGYVTQDGCGDDGKDGDDTPHKPVEICKLSHYYGSQLAPDVADDALVDIVFITYIQGKVVCVLNKLLGKPVYTLKDVWTNYTTLMTNQVLGLYAEQKWN